MQIISYPVHYQSVCTNFDFSLFSRISCNVKTPFLHAKNHTFTWRICNTQITNTLRTFRECILKGLRMRGEQIATTLQTDCHNILNKLQQHNIQKTKTILLQCKNPLFARQKPYFCNAKTILLHGEYVTHR